MKRGIRWNGVRIGEAFPESKRKRERKGDTIGGFGGNLFFKPIIVSHGIFITQPWHPICKT